MDNQLFLLVVTLILVVLMMYPSGMASFGHFKDLSLSYSTNDKAKHAFMGLFFLVIFGLSSYVAVENAKQLKKHTEVKKS